MKIAILTLPFHANYGGVLQAYALQTVLQRMGHEVVVLDKDMYYHRSWWRQQVALGAFLVRKYFLRQDTVYVNLWERDRKKRLKETRMRKFIDTHMNILKVRDLRREFPRNINAVIVGSDQVWRDKYFSWFYSCSIENAYLSFLEGESIKRIAYAASFGTDEWEYTGEETQSCAELLKLFDAVSVRESSAIDLCREKLGRSDAVRMPDPTLLLSPGDYRELFESDKKQGADPYLLYYVLDETPDVKSVAEKIAKDRGLALRPIAGDQETIVMRKGNVPVEEWLSSIAEAEFVFTDSFHACVFSIIFHKPFIVIGNTGRGMSRFHSLLSTFGLQRNMISSLCEYDPHYNYNLPDDIASVLEKEKARAMVFLNTCL